MSCTCPNLFLRVSHGALLIGAIGLALSGCKDSATLGSVHVKSELISAQNGGSILVEKSDHEALAGTRIDIEAGALAKDETITIGVVDGNLIDDGAVPAGPAVDFGPDGTRFTSAARVTIPYSQPFDEDRVRVYVREGNGAIEVLLPTDVVYNAQAKTITFAVAHFTSFQGAISNDACQHLVCPASSDGSVSCHSGRCGRRCLVNECGPRPEIANYPCPDGTVAGAACRRSDDGSCGWQIDRCDEPTLTCANVDCAEGFRCVDTDAQGPVCVPICADDSTDPANPIRCPCPEGDANCNVCNPDECGPAPGAPSRVCDDGSTAGPTCQRTAAGDCGWVITECPDPRITCENVLCAPGHHCVETGAQGPTCVPDCIDAAGDVCTCEPADCGTAPGVPTQVCDDGTTAGPVCTANADGTCGWIITECRDPNLSCANVLCAPGYHCIDGIAGPVCVPDCDANGNPNPNDPTDPNVACPSCPDSACGPRPEIADTQCPDGSVAGAVCRPTAAGQCGWEIIRCPEISCANVLCAPGTECVEGINGPECVPSCNAGSGNCRPCGADECGPAPGAPSQQCADGTIAGPVCERDPSDPNGTCGWTITVCPPPAVTCANVLCAPGTQCVETSQGPTCVPGCTAGSADPNCPCSNTECGPAPGVPSQQCADGTIAGPICERSANGTCGWNITTCPPTVSCDIVSCAPNTYCVETQQGPVCVPNCAAGDPNCAPTCTDAGCGPRPGAPNYVCPDGTTAGPICELSDNGDCGWNIVNCP